ncbi:MAG: glycosyltransferase family 2 protein [Bryobacterales bacterium]
MIPVLNEAHVLKRSVEGLCAFLEANFRYDWRVVVADNGSTDGTLEVAQELSQDHPRVFHLHLRVPGRGRALRFAWSNSEADAVCYMDVDQSTDLRELPKLIDALYEDGCDVAAGSRMKAGAEVHRSLKRGVISRGYNVFLKLALGVGFTDAQCGFKAATREAVQALVPRIEDESWFFDTELLVLAERDGMKICDLPVRWSEDDDSRVKIISTAWDDIKGVMRLRRALRRGAAPAAGMKARTGGGA